jgi:hypothetical protein
MSLLRQDRAISLLAEYLHEGRVVAAIGAGVSIDAGLPSAAALANVVCKYADLEPTSDLGVASERFLGAGRTREELDNVIREEIQRAQRSADAEPYRLLLELERLDNIITTNYDTLLESAHKLGDYDLIAENRDVRASAVRPSRRRIFKLYGSIDRLGPYLLTDAEIAAAADRLKLVVNEVVSLLTKHHIVFVGFRGRDMNWVRWLQALHDQGIGTTRVFYVNPSISDEDVGRFSQLGELVPIEMTARDFFQALSAASTERRVVTPRVGRQLQVNERRGLPQAENPFLFWKTDQIRDDAQVLSLFHRHAPLTNELFAPGNAIIVGGRGTGKSMLLRAMTTMGHLPNMSSVDDLRELAVYVKIGRDVRQETKWLQDEEEFKTWQRYYQHFLNLFVAEQIAETMSAAIKKLDVPTKPKVAKDILRILKVPLADLGDVTIHDLPREIALARALIPRVPTKRHELSQESTIATLIDYLRRAVPPVAEDRFVLLLDDYEGTEEQFLPLALWLSARRFDIKIGCPYFGLSDDATSFLQHREDYHVVDLDYHLLIGGKDKVYPSYVEDIANLRLKKFGAALSIRELLPDNPSSGSRYTGLNALIRLSSGQISKFVELCKDILIDAQGRIDIDGATLSQRIDERIQHRIVYEHSSVFAQEMTRDSHRGRYVAALLDAWGEYCKRRSEGTTQRTLRFSIKDPEHLGEQERLTLEYCLRLGVLQRASLRVPQSSFHRVPLRSYRLHRLLCPRYDLHLEDDHQRELDARHISLALESKADFINALLPRRANSKQLELIRLEGETEVPPDERI